MHWMFEPVQLFDRVKDAEQRVAYVRWQIERQVQWLEAHANDNPQRVAHERDLLAGMLQTLEEVTLEEEAVKADAARRPSFATVAPRPQALRPTAKST